MPVYICELYLQLYIQMYKYTCKWEELRHKSFKVAFTGIANSIHTLNHTHTSIQIQYNFR